MSGMCDNHFRAALRTFLTVFIITSLFFCIPRIHAFSGCEEDCQKCHTLSTDEVKLILKKIQAADARVLKTRMSPVKGLWEVAIENKGRRDVLYVDFSKKFLVAGAIVEVDASLNKTKERLDELNKERRINTAKIPLKDALVLGSNAASRKVIVFTDPE
jgi:thiol:disulfide interchange protein DsbC